MRTIIFLFLSILVFFSCRKDTFITASDARLNIGADTLSFDTVFTTIGSVTQSFKIRNDNDQKIRLTGIVLMGGSSSAYQLNINGSPISAASNLEIAAGDSIYLFVKVTVNPSTENLPFIVRDSIKINYNGITRWVQLQAYGQNARFIKNQIITSSAVWDRQLPYVILGGLTVDTTAILTIEKGTHIYCNANAPIIIHGTLKVNGEKDLADRVYFQGDRLDNGYKDLPGSWPGIMFTDVSKNNVLQFAVIKNAHRAILSTGGAANAIPKLLLNECIIDNAYDVGLLANNSSVSVSNCLFSNCGNDEVAGEGGSNILIQKGGKYTFDYTTIATVANIFQLHKQPVVYISNGGSNGATAPLTVYFKNSIIYGESGWVDDEIQTDKHGTVPFDVVLDNVLYKAKNIDLTSIRFLNNTSILANQSPLFDTINIQERIYNFHLQRSSPCIDKGAAVAGINFDLDGTARLSGAAPDIGCYELQQ